MDELRNLPDHDILLLLCARVEALQGSVEELKDNHARRVDALEMEKINKDEVLNMKNAADKIHFDHETRLRSIEKSHARFTGIYAVIGGAMVIIIPIIITYLMTRN